MIPRKNRTAEFLARALVIEGRHYGLDHPEVAATLTSLSYAYGTLAYT